jgi:rod shape determining protein RodA
VRSFVLLALIGATVPLLWHHLKPYQQQRVMTFLSPEMDPLGASCHVIQSRS